MNTRPRRFNLFQRDYDWNIVTGKWNYFLIVQSWSNVQDKYTFTASWSKRVPVYPQTFCNLYWCHIEHLLFWSEVVSHYIKRFSVVRWWFQKCPLSILERCPSHREYSYSQITEKRQGLTLGVHLTEVSVKRESWLYIQGILVYQLQCQWGSLNRVWVISHKTWH